MNFRYCQWVCFPSNVTFRSDIFWPPPVQVELRWWRDKQANVLHRNKWWAFLAPPETLLLDLPPNRASSVRRIEAYFGLVWNLFSEWLSDTLFLIFCSSRKLCVSMVVPMYLAILRWSFRVRGDHRTWKPTCRKQRCSWRKYSDRHDSFQSARGLSSVHQFSRSQRLWTPAFLCLANSLTQICFRVSKWPPFKFPKDLKIACYSSCSPTRACPLYVYCKPRLSYTFLSFLCRPHHLDIYTKDIFNSPAPQQTYRNQLHYLQSRTTLVG